MLRCKSILNLTVVLVTLSAAPALAAPPKVDYLYPAGAQRGTTAVISAGGTFEKWPVQAWCDRPGIAVTAAAEKGKLSIVVPADATPGVSWIRLYDAEGASSLRPFLVGLLPEIVEVEPNNDFAKPQSIVAANVTVNGQLEKAQDVDCFAVTLKQGQTLVASIEANRALGSPMDGVLQIVSADGFVLEMNEDDHGLDPQIAYPVPADGTYVVRVMAFPAEPAANMAFASGPSLVYRLTLTTGGFIDHVWPLATSATGPADAQVFGWNLAPAVQRLPFAVTPGNPFATIFSPQTANFLVVPVEPHAVVTEAQPSGAHEPQDVTVPVTITGRIAEPKERDAYRVTLKKGEALNVRVEARDLGSPLDPVLTIADALGKTIQRVDDMQTSRDAELAFTAPADGQYQILVADLNRRGGWRFVYRLRLTHPEPDFKASVAADAFVMTAGKPLEIPITIDRTAGFADEIEFSVAGLPATITAMPVKSVPKGETEKAVKLVLNATTGPWSGTVAITGKSAGALPRTRAAQAPALAQPPQPVIGVGTTARTSNLWLTVVPATAQK